MYYFKLQKFEFKKLIDDITIYLWVEFKFHVTLSNVISLNIFLIRSEFR